MKPSAVGGVVALVVVLVDQIVKAGVLVHFGSSEVDPSPLGPFLNLTLQIEPGHFVQLVRPRFRLWGRSRWWR